MSKLYYYELHEGAGDLLTNAILVSERQHSPDSFAELVERARQAVLETFEEDTLVEAVALELERSHGFTYVSDDKLTASMSVGADDEDTFLVETSDEYRTMVVDLDRN